VAANGEHKPLLLDDPAPAALFMNKDKHAKPIFRSTSGEGAGCHPTDLICLPIAFPFSFFCLSEREEVVILKWGVYSDTVKTPGIHYSGCCGREMRKIVTSAQTIELPISKIIDVSGSPLSVSAIVTFYFADPKRATIDITSPERYVRDQAQAVLKQVVSRFSYESTDHSVPCLKTEPAVVSHELVKTLQEKVEVAGTIVLSFDLNEISYAPEIAAGMLRRQQAQALISARRAIVEGAVEISSSAVASLERTGITMSQPEKAKLVTNLLTVICSDHEATPVVGL